MHTLLRQWAEMLDQATRSGNLPDSPEGTVTIQLSHTLAAKLSRHLRLVANEVVEHGSETWWTSGELEEAIEEAHRR